MILVTGATGIVGSHLLYFLLKENKRVRAIHRKDSDISAVEKIFAHYTSEAKTFFNKIEWIEADIIDIPALTLAFKNVTQVYHCAALIDFDPAKYKSLKKINVEGTANIVNLCLANSVGKLCYTSSVATFGTAPKDKMTNEETSWNPYEKNNVYALSKYGAEMEFWRGTQEGLYAVIVNPGIIFGISPHSDGSGLITDIASRGIPFYPPGGMGFVDVRDVVKAMILLMDSQIKNEQYILIGQNVSYKEILSKLARLNGNKPPSRRLSKPFMFFISGLDWISSKLFGTKRRLTKATIRSMFSTPLYDSSKIREELGFEFTPVDETLERIKMSEGKT